MVVLWTVLVPEGAEPVAAADPAVEAAMQAVSQCVNTYLWGEDKPPAVVYAEVGEDDVTVEDDDR